MLSGPESSHSPHSGTFWTSQNQLKLPARTPGPPLVEDKIQNMRKIQAEPHYLPRCASTLWAKHCLEGSSEPVTDLAKVTCTEPGGCSIRKKVGRCCDGNGSQKR